MRKFAAFLLPVLLLAGAVGAGAAKAADRIVSLGSDTTEILFALGKGGAIVGVDDTSMFPAATRKLNSVVSASATSSSSTRMMRRLPA